MMNNTLYLKIVLILIISLLVNGCSGKQEDVKKAPVAVRVVKPDRRDMAERMSYLGTVHARSEITVIAQVQGTVLSLPLAEGSKMKKGDVLVRLHAPELEAAVLRLQADRDYWKRRNTSDQRLLEQKAIPPDQEEASLHASDGADAAYSEAESRLQKTIEKAAFAGTVLRWYVEPGQHVMPGQPLLLIGDAKSEIRVDVVQEDVRRGLNTGTKVIIKGDKENILSGRIVEIAPLANAASRMMTIKIHWADTKSFDLPKGASATVDFILQSQNQALAVPVSAVADINLKPHIFLIKDNKSFKQDVKPGIEENGWIAVDFAWNGTDPVAVTNLNSLSDSTPVFAVPLRGVTQ